MNTNNECGDSTCGEFVSDGIQCGRCKSWYHQGCSKLSKKNYKLHTEHRSLKWICSQCVALAEECSRILRKTIGLQDKPDGTVLKGTKKSTKDAETMKVNKTIKGKRDNISKEGKLNKADIKRAVTGVTGDQHSTADLVVRMEKLEMELEHIKRVADGLVYKTKSLLIHNLDEPIIKDGKIRRETESRRIIDIFRLAGLAEQPQYIKCHRIGLWKGGKIWHPRPLLVVFKNTSQRDGLLARSVLIEERTGGRIRITPDSVVATKMISKNNNQVSTQINLKQPIIQTKQHNGTQGGDKNNVPEKPKKKPDETKDKTCNDKESPNTGTGHSPNGKRLSTPIGKSTPKYGLEGEKKVSQNRGNKNVRNGSGNMGGDIKITKQVAGNGKVQVAESKQEGGLKKVTEERSQVSWATVVAKTPVARPTTSRVTATIGEGKKESSDLSAAFGLTFSNISIKPNGVSWQALDPVIDDQSKNGPLPRVLRPRDHRV